MEKGGGIRPCEALATVPLKVERCQFLSPACRRKDELEDLNIGLNSFEGYYDLFRLAQGLQEEIFFLMCRS